MGTNDKRTKQINLFNMKNEEKKLSYEELENAARGLSEQNSMLQKQLRQMGKQISDLSEFVTYKRLDYLFKVVEMDTKFSADFVTTCITELEKSLVMPEEKEETK